MNYKSILVLLLYLLVGVIPPFDSLDKAITQNLYIYIVNILGAALIIYDRKKHPFRLKTKPIFVFLFLFFLWSIITTTQAVNISESLRILTDIFAYLFALPIIIHFVERIKNINRVLIILFISISIIEIFSVFDVYLGDLLSNELNFKRTKYKGITGNVNIQAFSLVLKLPLIIYFMLMESSHKFFKICLFIISVLINYAVIVVFGTRGALLFLLFFYLTSPFLFYFLSRGQEKMFKKIGVFLASLLLPLIIGVFQNSFSSFGINVKQRLTKTYQQETFDNSSNDRLRYYRQALSTIKENPLAGIGIGNWELENIKRESEYLDNYVIPYHVHNDFLEIAAETGIIGLILYSLFLFFPVYKSKKIFKIKNKRERVLVLFILYSCLSFFIDSSLNFPFARPIQQINIIFLLIFLSQLLKVKDLFKLNKFFQKALVFLLLALFPATAYSSYKIFNSYVLHNYLLSEYNYNNFNLFPMSRFDNLDLDYPSITGTSIPTKSLLAVKKSVSGDLESAVKLFKKGTEDNPYLYLSESYLGYTYFKLNKLDSARIYTKKAFDNIPNNIIHYTNYVFVLSLLKDTLAIKSAYNKLNLKYQKDPFYEELYLKAMSTLLDKDETNIILRDVSNKGLSEKSKNIKAYTYVLNIGLENTKKANELYHEGLDYFDEGNLIKSAEMFEKASNINPLEVKYLENAANIYMKLNNDIKASEMLKKIIDEFPDDTGKSYYMLALINLEVDKRYGCECLKKSSDNGFKPAIGLYRAYCN